MIFQIQILAFKYNIDILYDLSSKIHTFYLQLASGKLLFSLSSDEFELDQQVDGVAAEPDAQSEVQIDAEIESPDDQSANRDSAPTHE